MHEGSGTNIKRVSPIIIKEKGMKNSLKLMPRTNYLSHYACAWQASVGLKYLNFENFLIN